MDSTTKTILQYWRERQIPVFIPRDADAGSYLDMTPNVIIAITGFRRVTKTSILLDLARGLRTTPGRIVPLWKWMLAD